jgi:hypothetical protein
MSAVETSAYSQKVNLASPWIGKKFFSGPAKGNSVQEAFYDAWPQRPYCSDNLQYGIGIRAKRNAVASKYVQFNGPVMVRSLSFDVDRADGALAAEAAGLPLPTVVSQNPDNGHALITYSIAKPILKAGDDCEPALRYMAAAERGCARRLGADLSYCGLIGKNPFHPDWRTMWLRPVPYLLDELADALTKQDMRPFDGRSEVRGLSRNCDVFNDTRKWAYRSVLPFKRDGGLEGQWFERVYEIACGHNLVFSVPLHASELRAIATSIAKWTWRQFTEAKFSHLQSQRGKRGNEKRWSGHHSANRLMPWYENGQSRAAYYRRQQAQRQQFRGSAVNA